MSNSDCKIFSTQELRYIISKSEKFNPVFIIKFQKELAERKISKKLQEVLSISDKWQIETKKNKMNLVTISENKIVLKREKGEVNKEKETYDRTIKNYSVSSTLIHSKIIRILLFCLILLFFVISLVLKKHTLIYNLSSFIVMIGLLLLFYIGWMNKIFDSVEELKKNRKIIFNKKSLLNKSKSSIECCIYESEKLQSSIENIKYITFLWFYDASQEQMPIEYDLWLQVIDENQITYPIFKFESKYELFEIVNTLADKLNLDVNIIRTYNPPRKLY